MIDNTFSQQLSHKLASIRIVMVGTTLPANIGSAARALHTMGISELVVVNPRLPIDDSSVANAAGATELLQKTRVLATLDEAISDCHLVLAASARSRHMPRPVLTPHLAAQLMDAHLNQTQTAKIAILFGREDRGLTNEELACAQYHVQIPANPDYPVLNVASAIQVIVANIYAQLSGANQPNQAQLDDLLCTKQTQGNQPNMAHIDVPIRSVWDEAPITHAQANHLNQATIELMQKLNLAHDHELKHLPNRLMRLTHRLQLDQKEYTMLRALLAKITRQLQ